MAQLPSVGIITRTKNRSVLLRRAIRSVIHQSYTNWRMIIVNDGGDPAEVEYLVNHFSDSAQGRIRAVHNPRSMGMEGASRTGLDHSEEDLLVFHDDDDSWAPEFLNIAVHELLRIQAKFPSTEGVATWSQQVWETVRGNLVEIQSVAPFNDWVPGGFLSLDRMLAGNFIPPISFVFSRKGYVAAGHEYERIPYLGDWDFLIRFLARHDVVVVPQYLAFYHWRSGGEAGDFGNSVTAEVDRHHFYRQYLLNSWLREDLAMGRTGIGTYANLRMHIETLLQRPSVTASNHSSPPALREDLPQEIVDYYWESRSWKLLAPIRHAIRKVAGLPREEKPVIGNVEEAWTLAKTLQDSVSWNITAPLRSFKGLFSLPGAIRRGSKLD